MKLYVVTLVWTKKETVGNVTHIDTGVSTHYDWYESDGDAFFKAYENNKNFYPSHGLTGKSITDITEVATNPPLPVSINPPQK